MHALRLSSLYPRSLTWEMCVPPSPTGKSWTFALGFELLIRRNLERSFRNVVTASVLDGLTACTNLTATCEVLVAPRW